ncbi:hypothetical protein [Paraburkholderia strydomiana]
MTLFFLMCFGVGLIGGIPVWIVWQHFRRRYDVQATRRFDHRHEVPFEATALVLNGRPVPQDAAAAAAPSAASGRSSAAASAQ